MNIEAEHHEKERRAREAIRMSVKPLPLEASVSGSIIPEVSELGKLLCQRRSVRSFSEEEIPQWKLERVLVDCAGGVELVPMETVDGESFDMLRRTIPQGGGICAVGTSLILLRASGHYAPGYYAVCSVSNALHKLPQKYDAKVAAAAMRWDDLGPSNNAAAILILSADVGPKEYKYGKFGDTLALVEVGCALQNASLSACDVGIAGYASGGVNADVLSEIFNYATPVEAPHVAYIIGMPVVEGPRSM